MNTHDRYLEARAFVFGSRKASASWLQRNLRIGYNEAALYIEKMEDEGFVSQPSKTGVRTILAETLAVQQ